MIYMLFILLVFVLLVIYLLNRKDLTTPSLIFTASFVFSTAWACLYAEKWNMNNMYINTIAVIFGGVVEFFVITLIIKSFFDKKNVSQYEKDNSNKLELINVDLFIKLICIMLCVVTIFWNINIVLKTTNRHISELKQAIFEVNDASKFSSTILKQPKLLGLLLLLINGMGYWFLYIIVNNFIANKKIDKLSVIIVLLWIVNSLLRGGRNDVVNFALAGIAIAYILLKKKNSFRKKIKLKLGTKIFIVILPIIFFISFPKLGLLLGRNIKHTPMDYLAEYCGAQIKNLDMFLLERDFDINYKKSSNIQTFNTLFNWIGLKTGLLNEKYVLDLPYRQYNDFNLGNVHTTFYPYIYDFGYKGVVFCIALMAIISQVVYEKAKINKVSNKPNLWVLAYGYMFSSLLLSFFSNKFYEQNFNRTFIYSIIFWNLFNYFFIKYKSKPKLNVRMNENIVEMEKR